jgi:hypothetical protein
MLKPRGFMQLLSIGERGVKRRLAGAGGKEQELQAPSAIVVSQARIRSALDRKDGSMSGEVLAAQSDINAEFRRRSRDPGYAVIHCAMSQIGGPFSSKSTIG